jgi:flagellin
MGLRINQNIAAMNAYRNLSVTDGQMSKSLERLSSGFRINRAADDAAGLAISEGLRAQTGGLKVAVRNAQDGISVVQTAEGALTETHSILQRMRDLAVQAANDSNDAESRTAINAESNALKSELQRIATKTTYNNINLLDGTFASKQFQVGYAASDTIAVSITGGSTPASITFTDSTVSAASTFEFTQAAGGGVGSTHVVTGTIGVTTTAKQTMDALNADAAFSSAFVAQLDAAGTNVKVTSKTGNTTAIALTTAATGTTAAAGVVGSASNGGFSDTDLGVNGISLLSQANATTALGLIDTAIKTVSASRASLGALQNRFEHTINNLNVAVENLSASESRIRDTDMAQEMVSFTRSQILSQAGTSMLSQANQAPQSVLSLLR